VQVAAASAASAIQTIQSRVMVTGDEKGKEEEEN